MAFVIVIIIFVSILLLLHLNDDKSRTNYYGRNTDRPDYRFDEYYSDKGVKGEDIVFDAVAGVRKASSKIIRNCWLRFPNGTITEVDLVLICKTGIYVVESKNYITKSDLVNNEPFSNFDLNELFGISISSIVDIANILHGSIMIA